MKEQLAGYNQLTANRVSSTLSVRSTMPEPPKDNNSPRIRPEGSHRADNSDVDKIWRQRARESMTQGEVEARKILEEIMKKHGLSPDSAANPYSESFARRNEQTGENSPYRYDAQNMMPDEPGVEEPEDIPHPARHGSERGARGIPDAKHPDLRAITDELKDPTNRIDPDQLREMAEIIREMESSDPANPIPSEERDALVQALSSISAKGERIGFYLQDDDRAELMVDAQGWLDGKFDLIYLASQTGQELDSQVLQGIQSLVGEANQFLSRRFQKSFDEGNIAEREKYRNSLDLFNRTFATRINLLVGRVTIDRRSGMEQIAGAWGRLRAEGLLGSLSFDDARVGAMFNRMNEFLEDIRLKEGGEKAHLTTEMVSNMQKRIEAEQFKLAEKDVGVFADEYKKIKMDKNVSGGGSETERNKRTINSEEALRAEIRRAVRTAYDVFVNSQRLAIISARGRNLGGDDAFYSDPGGAFNFFNLEELSIEKYRILNEPQLKFMRFIQMDMATNEKLDDPTEKLTHEQLKERGRRLYRDMSAAPDFFSSVWRVKGMLQQIEKVTRYKLENEEIVKDLLGRKDDDITKSPVLKPLFDNFRDFLDARGSAAGFSEMSEAQQQAFKIEAARDFAKGNTAVTNGRLINGLDFDQRTKYINELVASSLLNPDSIKTKTTEIASDFALFMQIRQPGAGYDVFGDPKNKEQKDAWKKNTWKKVRDYRPEEIMRLVRERMDPKYAPDAAFLKGANAVFSDVGGSYDDFKEQYGAVIKSIREEGFRDGVGRQVNIADITKGKGLTAEQKEKIDRVMGSGHAEKVIAAYGKMQDFIDRNNLVSQMVTSWRYEDLKTRTITVDDAILSDLEYVPDNSGITRLSQFWTNEAGADALQRNGNDFRNNEAAGKAQIELLLKEKDEDILKASEAQAHATGEYNGPDASARVFRYGYGSELRFGLQDYWADILQLGKLPLRISSSERERVRGPGSKPLTSEEARGRIDQVMGMLEGREDGGKYLHQLEDLLRADAANRMKDRAFGVAFYLLLALLIAPAAAGLKAGTESATK